MRALPFLTVFLAAASPLAFASCAEEVDSPPTGSVASAGGGTSSSDASSADATSTGTSNPTTSGTGQGGGSGTGGAGSTTTGGGGDASTTSSSGSTGAGGCAPYSNTIVIDGTNDFDATNDAFATTTGSFTGYVSWDANYVYFGLDGTDVGQNDSNKFLLVYLGGPNGTTTGQVYNTQQPTLPFSAAYCLRWKGDNTLTQLQTWNGASWGDGTWSATGNVFQNGTFIELRVARADLGDPDTLPVHISMINEVSNGQATFGGVPSTSFTDGVDPNYTAYVDLDLGSCDPPADAPIQ